MKDKTCSQIDRFKEAARELGCDESEATFDEKIKAIVKKKPAPPALGKNGDNVGGK